MDIGPPQRTRRVHREEPDRGWDSSSTKPAASGPSKSHGARSWPAKSWAVNKLGQCDTELTMTTSSETNCDSRAPTRRPTLMFAMNDAPSQARHDHSPAIRSQSAQETIGIINALHDQAAIRHARSTSTPDRPHMSVHHVESVDAGLLLGVRRMADCRASFGSTHCLPKPPT